MNKLKALFQQDASRNFNNGLLLACGKITESELRKALLCAGRNPETTDLMVADAEHIAAKIKADPAFAEYAALEKLLHEKDDLKSRVFLAASNPAKFLQFLRLESRLEENAAHFTL